MRQNTRIKTGRRLILLLSHLHAAHTLVARAMPKPNGDGSPGPEITDREVVNRLAKLISLNKKTALPHPNWKPIHDAVLITAIAKHGWIDRDAARRAITEDASITWGRPFDDGDISPAEVGSTKESEASPRESTEGDDHGDDAIVRELKVIAKRAADFFNAEGSILGDLKGFNQDLVEKNYGLVKEDEDGAADGDVQAPPTWRVDETLLAAGMNSSDVNDNRDRDNGGVPEELSDLPSKKEVRGYNCF